MAVYGSDKHESLAMRQGKRGIFEQEGDRRDAVAFAAPGKFGGGTGLAPVGLGAHPSSWLSIKCRKGKA